MTDTQVIKNQFIFHTDHPLPGIRHLAGSLYEPNLLEQIRDTFTFKLLIDFINDALHVNDPHFNDLPDDPEAIRLSEIREIHIDSLNICPDNLAIWLVTFNDTYTDVDKISLVLNEGMHNRSHITGSDDDTHGDQAHVNEPLESNEQFDISKMETVPVVSERSKPPCIYVGILERYAHDKANFNSTEATHADAVAKIISDSFIKPISIPLIPDGEDRPATVFDLICALSRKCVIDKVQILNISMGYNKEYGNGVLRRVLRDIRKPIICAAGQNNDERPHWPSNFSAEFSNVVSVTSEGGNEIKKDKKGNVTNMVDVCARGQWDVSGRIKGTSFAAAWVSKMFALAFAKEYRVNMNLHDVIHCVEKVFDLEKSCTLQTRLDEDFSTNPPKGPET